MKKIPIRQCVVTKEKFPKKELIRIVRTTSDQVVIDQTGKVNGRGAYIKKDLDVVNNPNTLKILSKHLEINVSIEIIEQIINDVIK